MAEAETGRAVAELEGAAATWSMLRACIIVAVNPGHEAMLHVVKTCGYNGGPPS